MKSIIIFFLLIGVAFAGDCVSKKNALMIETNNECIQYIVSKGEVENELNIIVHGTWKEGSNILARYKPFVEDLVMQTDVTTIAVALPGYLSSSKNMLKPLWVSSKLVNTQGYVDFMATLIKKLKKKYKVTKVNFLGHSAGATLGANVLASYPNLISNALLVGGDYEQVNYKQINKKTKIVLVYGSKDKISIPLKTISFYELLKSIDSNVTLVEVLGGVHLDLEMSDDSVESFIEMIES